MGDEEMPNFQDELAALVDKWLGLADDPESMISDLESEISRLRDIEIGPRGDDDNGE